MSGWKAKRFWKAATTEACDGGFTVRLDGRPVKTPAKSLLVVPTQAMAEAIAAEWDEQQGVIRPDTMPITRFANSAIDKVGPLFDAVVDEVSGFGGSDLLCYRAETPMELVARQATDWDPLLDWIKQAIDAPLNVTAGVIPIAQPEDSLNRLRSLVAEEDRFRLAALHDLVAITGSLILGLAVARGRLSADQAFQISRIDEHWQAELWGEDEEAAEIEALKRKAIAEAERFYKLCG